MSERNIQFSPPDISQEEIDEIIGALKSGWITTGPRTKEFEKQIAQLCTTDKVACFNSSTAAMEMTLRLFGIGAGDEVIVPAYTYTATASVICHVGAKPVIIDTERDSYKFDKEALRSAITDKTKAIMPVDIAGVMEDYDEIIAIAEEYKDIFKPSSEYQRKLNRILVLADSAHGIGADRNGKMSGSSADFTTFSFHAVKNLITAEGGAVTWINRSEFDNEEIYKKFMLYSLHGQTKDALAKSKPGSWEYDIVEPLYKCNMTDIHAAIGLAQIKRYPRLLERRREIIRLYEGCIITDGTNQKVEIIKHSGKDYNSSCHLMLVRLIGRDEEFRNRVIERMAEKGISCNVHYKPLPMLTAYKNLGYDIKDFPNAYNQYCNEITLPLHTLLTDDDVRYISENFNEVVGNVIL